MIRHKGRGKQSRKRHEVGRQGPVGEWVFPDRKRGGGGEWGRRLFSWLLPILVLFLAGVIAWLIMITVDTPEPEPEGERVVVVRSVEVRREPHRLDVRGRGNVRPAREVVVLPQVSGRIKQVNPRLAPGGVVRSGELLVSLEEDDFLVALREAEAMLTDARAELELERGRQEVAEEEWRMFQERLGDKTAREPSALALREPQLMVARGQIEAAEAQLERARLDLQRTRIHAPFDAVVLRERASRGQLVGPEAEIAHLVGAEFLWIEAAVRMGQIDYISIPDLNAEEGSIVRVWQDLGDHSVEWTGRVVRLLGDLSPEGLMARVLVEVPDPFLRENAGEIASKIPLLLNASVQLEFEGRRVEELVEVPRAAVREGDRVFVATPDQRLSIRQPEIVWRLPESLLVRTDVEDGERVVISPVPVPAEGLRLREAE